MYQDIADHIYSNPKELDLNLKGFWISDREYYLVLMQPFLRIFPPASLSFDVIQEEIPALQFVQKYQNVFAFKCVLYYPYLHLLLSQPLCAVIHSWVNSKLKQHPVVTQTTSMILLRIHPKDSSHILEIQQRRNEDVIFGIQFIMLLSRSILRLIYTESSTLCVQTEVYNLIDIHIFCYCSTVPHLVGRPRFPVSPVFDLNRTALFTVHHITAVHSPKPSSRLFTSTGTTSRRPSTRQQTSTGSNAPTAPSSSCAISRSLLHWLSCQVWLRRARGRLLCTV